MKKIFALMLIVGFTFTGCLFSDDEATGLVDQWQLKESAEGMTMIMDLNLKGDGTFSMSAQVEEMKMVVMTQAGTYTTSDSTITLNATDCQEVNESLTLAESECEDMGSATYSVNGNSLVLTIVDPDTQEEESQTFKRK